MNEMNERLLTEDADPSTAKALQDFSTSDYDEKCKDLEKCILKAYYFFMWYGSKNKNRHDELRSILFLECFLLRMLEFIKDIFGMRNEGLYNEATDTFKDLLVLMNDQMHCGTCYIRSSNNCLESELANEDSGTAIMRRDVVDGFSGMTVWMNELTQHPQIKKQAKDLIDELGLNYQKRMFGCTGDNFEQHTNMVLNGLMMLAVPSHTDAADDEFVGLFKNSFGAFRESNYCKEELEVLLSQIEDDYHENGLSTNEQKIVHLKKLWGAKKAEIRHFLYQQGLSYTNTISDACIGKMGRRLYEALNMDSEVFGKKMSNDELHHYFLKEAQLAFLASEIERLKNLDDDPLPGKEFFAETVKRSDLHQALYKTINEEQGLVRNGEKRYVLGAQGHWLAVLKVMQAYGMVRGTMSDFAVLMKKWYPTPHHPCDYRSMISVKAFDVKKKPYPEWSKVDTANYPYLRVADTFVKYLREYNLVE